MKRGAAWGGRGQVGVTRQGRASRVNGAKGGRPRKQA